MYYTDDFLHERFLDLVLNELRLRHVPVDRREFMEFMEAMAPLIMPESDSPQRWADAFMEAMAVRVA